MIDAREARKETSLNWTSENKVCEEAKRFCENEIDKCIKEQIKEDSKKLVELAADIDEKEHPKPAFLMVITTQNVAIQDENGVYTVPLGCLKP